MNDIKIILLKNPFNPSDVEITYCELVPNKTAYQYVAHLMMGNEFVVSVNGIRVDDSYIPVIGDNIAVCASIMGGGGGDGKNILGTIAMLALSIYTGNIAGGLWSSSPFMSSVYAMGVMAIGGAIINSIFPPPKADNSSAYSSSSAENTYGWGNETSLLNQGQPLPVTFGTYLTKGSILSRHVFYEGTKQYLSIVLTGGEGPIDSITDIKINDNPIANYESIVVETRLGTNDQAVLNDPSFTKGYADKTLSYELVAGSDWSTDVTDGNAGEGLEISLTFPSGLYSINSSGGDVTAWVDIESEYRLQGATTWNVLKKERISAMEKSSFTKTYSVSDLPVGRYEVRCRCTAKSGSGSRDATRVGWSQLTQVINTNFARVGKTVVALKILATDQLSGGMPNISWIQTRGTVNVWNPDTQSYETQSASSPAWACYDIIHHCRKLKNTHTGLFEFTVFGKPANRLNYYDFKKWDDFCTSRNLTFNFIYTSVYDLWGALKLPESVGRGKVLTRGTSYSAVCDMPSSPVQLFSIGNIGQGEFKLTYLPMKDRADAVEVSFSNKVKNYQKDPIIIYGDAYDTSESAQNPTQITLEGCVNYEQAYLAGKYYLRLNKYLLRTITFPADIDAIACQTGDVILVNHDTLNMDYAGEDTGSGRIISATATTVLLDREILMNPNKQYGIHIQCDDGTILVKNVVYTEGVTDTLTIEGEFSTIPKRFNNYGFGEIDKVTRPYRVASITRSGELKRVITALEYFDEIYVDDGVIPDRYSESTGLTPPTVTGASLSQEYYAQKDSTIISNLNSSIIFSNYSNIAKVSVYYSLDGMTTWIYSGYTKNDFYTITNVKTKSTYFVKFIAEDMMGMKGNAYISEPIYITGKDNPPSDVEFLSIVQVGSNLVVSVSEVRDIDFKHYELRLGSSWEFSVLVSKFTATQIEIEAPYEGTASFWVKAIDNSLNPSENAKLATINIVNLPIKNVLIDQPINFSDLVLTDCYIDSFDGKIKLKSNNVLGDFVHFADIFTLATFSSNTSILIPSTDISEDITESNLHDMKLQVKVSYNENPKTLISTSYRTKFLPEEPWGEFQIIQYRNFYGRLLQVQLLPLSLDGRTDVDISAISTVIDVDDLVEDIYNIAIPATKTRILYTSSFFTTPKWINLTTMDSTGMQCIWRRTNTDKYGFDLELLDSSGNLVSGTLVHANVRGY